MKHPVLWLIGYYEISVPLSSSAEFVELAAALNIDFCDGGVCKTCERRKFLISARLAPRIVRACISRGIDVSTDNKRGAPMLLFRVLKRPGIAVALPLFFALAILSQKVIWKIEIVGNDRLEYAEVCSMLDECGMRIGVFKSTLDVDKISNRLLINTDKVSWMSINIEGTVASVEIRESLPQPSPEPPTCSNVIATENGVIVGFDNIRGNVAVSIGEAVSKGDLLIGGVYGNEGEATRFVRATGSVWARTNRELEVSIPLKYSKKVYTGRQKTQKTLIFFEKEVKFFGNSRNLYASCDTIDKVEYFDFWGLGKLPIAIRTTTYVEYEYAECVLGEDEARAEAKRTLWQNLAQSSSSGAELVSSSIEITMDENNCYLYARIECIEDIAREQEVEISIVP